jgi:hypothetical protein
MKYLFLILLFAFSCKSKQVVQPPTPKQDSAQVNNNLPSTLDTEEIINQVIEGIKNGSILIDSCGYMPVDGTNVVSSPSTPRMERIKGRNERKLTKINRRFDLKESKVEARKIIDSIRIITKIVYDTVKVRSEEVVKVEKIESKQAIKETRIEQSWKKWLIVGFFVFLFLLIIVLLLLRRMKIL